MDIFNSYVKLPEGNHHFSTPASSFIKAYKSSIPSVRDTLLFPRDTLAFAQQFDVVFTHGFQGR